MLTTVHLRRDRRKQQQQQLASYMTEHVGDVVVEFGGTRLGENAGIIDRSTKRATIERQAERQRQRDMNATVGDGLQLTWANGDARMTAAKVSWSSSAGSPKNKNGAWLGGVTMAAVGEAAKR